MLSHHVIDYRPDGYTIAHPLRCRARGLFDCPITEAEVHNQPVPDGRYVCTVERGKVVPLAPADDQADDLAVWAIWSSDSHCDEPRLRGIALSDLAAARLIDEAMEHHSTFVRRNQEWRFVHYERAGVSRWESPMGRWAIYATRPKVTA